MNSKKTVAVATLGLLTGCGSAGPMEAVNSSNPGPQTEALASRGLDKGPNVAHELELLEQLNIVHVGELVRNYPEGAMNCYGPCPEFEHEIAEEDARQALRLQELVNIAAEAASVTLNSEVCSVEVIDENLAALDGLDIVEVFGLVEEVPQNNPYCYNLPCAEDIERAEEINCQRATALATIIAEAEEL